MGKGTCTQDGCSRAHVARGYCSACYNAKRKSGELRVLPTRARPACALSECDDPAANRDGGWCAKHNARAKRHGGDPRGGGTPKVRGGQPCSVDGCPDRVDARGYCQLHYTRYMKTGDPLAGGLLSEAERLAVFVAVGGANECWPWTGLTDKNGYGVIKTSHGNRAHRAAWALANNQSVPSGLLIRHSCDNPPCCNPAHLLVGDHLQNMQDKVDRNRHLFGDRHWSRKTPDLIRGDSNGNHKLSDETVAEIKGRVTGRYGELKEMAAEYGVSFSLIQKIKSGHLRRHR